MTLFESKVTFHLPRQLAEEIDRIATVRGTKRSEILREAIREFTTPKPATTTTPTPEASK